MPEMKNEAPTYSITTYDVELGEFTPQDGLTVPSIGVPWRGIRPVLRQLQSMGYSCDRVRVSEFGGHVGDPSVLVERLDQ